MASLSLWNRAIRSCVNKRYGAAAKIVAGSRIILFRAGGPVLDEFFAVRNKNKREGGFYIHFILTLGIPISNKYPLQIFTERNVSFE